MTNENTSTALPAESVDEMAANLGKKLQALVDERDLNREWRDKSVARIKVLDVEIDKAERMTKALIPRHRSSTKKAEVD